jgi:hypothetical protein
MMRKNQKLMLAPLVMVLLSTCAGSDEDMARFLVAPGKFDLYTCPELIREVGANGQRRRQLEQLMAKAVQEDDGRLVSTLVYRPDYLSAQGELRDLREAAAAKKCNLTQLENAASFQNANTTSDALPALR